MICLLGILFLGVSFTANENYTAIRSNNDGKTRYWQYSDGPCTEVDRKTKRPIQTINSFIGYNSTSTIGGVGSSSSSNFLENLKDQQGNCPYQIEDIYKSGVAYDFFILAAILAAIGLFLALRKYKDIS